jgi:hypothetical protein
MNWRRVANGLFCPDDRDEFIFASTMNARRE